MVPADDSAKGEVLPQSIEEVNRRFERLDIAWLWLRFVGLLKNFDNKLQDEVDYKIAKELLALLRASFKLILYLLAPTFFLLYGLEIISSSVAWYYHAIGWCLIIICCLLSGLLAVASFSRESGGNGEAAEITGSQSANKNKDRIGGVLVSVDVIAVCIILVLVLLTPTHEFRLPPLRYAQNKVNDWIHDQTVASIAGATNNADEVMEFNVRHDERVVSVRAIGEEATVGTVGKVDWVDYGWIEDLNKKRVWEMKDGDKVPLGGKYQRTYEVTDRLELNPGAIPPAV